MKQNTDQHTPGPWEWTANYPSSANEPTWTLIDGTGYGILSCDGIENSPQGLGNTGIANARLIAASPDLLEALKNLLFASENADETGYVTDAGFLDLEALQEAARAAIAKAQPEQKEGM